MNNSLSQATNVVPTVWHGRRESNYDTPCPTDHHLNDYTRIFCALPNTYTLAGNHPPTRVAAKRDNLLNVNDPCGYFMQAGARANGESQNV